MKERKMPIPAFNASFADTGDSLVISPFVFPCDKSQRHLLEFYKKHHPDPLVATAARLSATFSYISPICQARIPAGEKATTVMNHRVADGGYVDNGGLLTATRWTKRLLMNMGERPPFRNVIFLQLIGFPLDPPAEEKQAGQDRDGFWWEAFGPVITLNSARFIANRPRRLGNRAVLQWLPSGTGRGRAPAR